MKCPYCSTDLNAGDCTQSAIFATDKAARIANLRASIAALSNAGKTERERMNVREFLLNLGVAFVDSDIVSVPTQDEPPDVLFGAARFEIKELYDADRRRGDEYKRRLLEAQAATRCEELRPLSPYCPKDTTVTEVLELAVATGLKYSKKYNEKRGPTLVQTLDLLLYHNLVDVMGMAEKPFPNTSQLCQQGWRSVSVLFGHRAIVFCASANAPSWLGGGVGAVMHRN